MSENRTEIITGAIVLVVALGFLLWAGRGMGIGADGGSYPLHASFRSIGGVVPGTDVRLAGVKVGTVTDVALNPKTFFADTTISVKKGVALPEDTVIAVTQDGLLGANYIELIPGGAIDDLKPGDEILDTQSAVSMLNLMLKFAGGGSGDGAGEGAQ
ncbi:MULTISPECIES: outer membrane lipid asymmetry maintenance protein MlaD [Thioclava]|uniref:Outer membrane lipid asymmetry maintenance protein MlaD n=1 Tax=Thioclava nitratireducens TaxID=1915078 RepID=A0ABN4X5E4_9RHOB|nr:MULTISPECIES: outer membrane lipid asymmetry maintenance protein MlaD [Thioclava]AQS47682.1 outer membrane lipid asymmetry maintenance protein MlaD [Thioclava nitratireducens]OWY04056.1 outer membrane lipid asymmetry maintenance protein MlaD [Thioclava sp. IC9]OWY05576.1 outer membrane lipid asymmetry maintenance protein MlaD [Thioclava sp. F1Mire-8]OWY10873.1 outer membrane lipid asymmetry maintenance protein MlaD [Thioclava sp. F42-5]OWY14057.1 outer membrane lipid asymmetry maintenance p